MTLEESSQRQVAILCENLKQLRLERMLTIQQLSQKTQIPETVLCDVERGKAQKFHAGYLIRICQFYHTVPSQLIRPMFG